ncbi:MULTISPECIES: hypothetical protein [Burkholderia]|uniref:hypothetical protein n=1 Tax=Burkholderia TaxID=32008 RepID=UPI000B925520|nr:MULTISPECIES: hypothetical protein [Burkholderia]OXJ00818.1 hypothetical protein CFB41_17035 [Burkholderia sp. AU33803]
MEGQKTTLEGLGIKLMTWRAKPRDQRQVDEVRWEFLRRRAGRFRLREIINFLSKNTETKPEWWADALVDAIGKKDLQLRNPRNLADAKPLIAPGKPVPRTLRAYEDCVDVDDVNRWLDGHPDWRVTFRFAPRRRSELQAEVVPDEPMPSPSAGITNGQEATCVSKPLPVQRHQEQEILRVLHELGYNPLALPKRVNGKRWVAAEVRGKLVGPKWTKSIHDKAWERLRENGDIKETE